MTQCIWQVMNNVESESYDIGHFRDENQAWLAALGVITDYAGDWSDYSSDDIVQFCVLVEAGEFREAVKHWNNHMTGACFVYVDMREVDEECATVESVKQFLRDYNMENMHTNEN